MARRKRPHQEGDWFAVPLGGGEYALGLVARMDGRNIAFGYFFGPARDELPRPEDTRSYTPADAIHVSKFGDGSLLMGGWPIVYRDPNWDRNKWPMPAFVGGRPRALDPNEKVWIYEYSEDDLAGPIGGSQVSGAEAAGLPNDGLDGDLFVVYRLTDLLKGDTAPSPSASAVATAPAGIEHFLYFPRKDQAQRAADALRDQGYQVEVRRSGDDTNWLALASQAHVPTHEALEHAREQMEVLASSLGGEYDGWEAEVSQ